MKKYDLILVDFPYEEKFGEFKRRPALIISHNEILILGAKITTKEHSYYNNTDYKIKQWEKAGLKRPSIVRLSKKIKLNPNQIIKIIGHLDKVDIENVEKMLRNSKIKKSEALDNSTDNNYPALLVALDSEKDAVVTYETLLELTDNEEEIELLKKILDDEKEHIALLSALQANQVSDYVAEDSVEEFNDYVENSIIED